VNLIKIHSFLVCSHFAVVGKNVSFFVLGETIMSIVQAENLTKTYKRYKKEGGIRGSIRGLFHREYEYKTANRNYCANRW
jgi:hypothetical protein